MMNDSKTRLHIRNIDVNLKQRHQEIAKEKGLNFSDYIIKILEENDPLEQYRKLYEETSHQQAQTLKVMNELTEKVDKVYNIMKRIEDE